MKKILTLSLLLALTACKKDKETNLPAPAEAISQREAARQTVPQENDVPETTPEPERIGYSETINCFPTPDAPVSDFPSLPAEPVVTLPETSPFGTTTLKTQSFTIDALKSGTLIGKEGGQTRHSRQCVC